MHGLHRYSVLHGNLNFHVYYKLVFTYHLIVSLLLFFFIFFVIIYHNPFSISYLDKQPNFLWRIRRWRATHHYFPFVLVYAYVNVGVFTRTPFSYSVWCIQRFCEWSTCGAAGLLLGVLAVFVFPRLKGKKKCYFFILHCDYNVRRTV